MSLVDIATFFPAAFFILGCALVGAAVFKKVKLPPVIGELFIGILIGPTILALPLLHYYTEASLSVFNNMSVAKALVMASSIALLFVAGLEITPTQIRREKRAIVSIGLLAMVLPFLAGIYMANHFFTAPGSVTNQWGYVLTVGAVFMVSALPVIARVLIDLNLLKHRIGSIIIGTAMVSDVVGLSLLAIALGIATGTVDDSYANELLLLGVPILTFIAFIVIPNALRRYDTYLQSASKEEFSLKRQSVLSAVVLLLFCSSFYTLGFPPLLGAFLAGLALSEFIAKPLKKRLRAAVLWVFSPLYFVSIGLETDFASNFDLSLILIVLLLAFASKLIATWIGGYFSGLTLNESTAVGLGLAARGGMEIVVADIAFKAGVIDIQLFTALVIMAVFSSFTAVLISVFVPSPKRSQEA